MKDNFVPECYFDTVLVKTILKVKQVNHKKGCPNVVRELEKGKLKDDFAVGIIDKDKKELDYIKDQCEEKIKVENLILFKHKTKQHYFIQLVPAIEKWILTVIGEAGLNVDKFGLNTDLNKLRKRTKSELVNEDKGLKDLCTELVSSDSKTVTTLSSWLNYLFEHNRNADINVLKEHV
jgi:hypothetical protein